MSDASVTESITLKEIRHALTWLGACTESLDAVRAATSVEDLTARAKHEWLTWLMDAIIDEGMTPEMSTFLREKAKRVLRDFPQYIPQDCVDSIKVFDNDKATPADWRAATIPIWAAMELHGGSGTRQSMALAVYYCAFTSEYYGYSSSLAVMAVRAEYCLDNPEQDGQDPLEYANGVNKAMEAKFREATVPWLIGGLKEVLKLSSPHKDEEDEEEEEDNADE